MVLAEIISSTHSKWRVGFILRITRESSGENCRSSSSPASAALFGLRRRQKLGPPFCEIARVWLMLGVQP